MALPIDTGPRIHGPNARLALVNAVAKASDHEIETDWLEWKSSAPLGSKAWQGELATHILGFANREPRAAQRNTQGYAYLIVGAEAGSVAGIKPIDSAKLEDGITRFVGGADGPSWEPAYVEVDGKHVLVITVDPPERGDPIRTLRKAFTDPGGKTHHDGRIFIRRIGKTSPEPTSAEIAMLEERARSVHSQLDLQIAIKGEATIAPLDLTERGAEGWRGRERSRLLADLPANAGKPVSPQFRIPSMFEEHRSPSVFRKEVEDYLDRAVKIFPEIARVEAITAGIGRLALAVHNTSNDNFHKLLLELHIGGNVMAFFDADEAEERFEWPKVPRKYGSSRLTGIGSFDIPRVRPLNLGEIDNSASARVRYPVFDLRPGYTRDLTDIYLLVDQSRAGDELIAHWLATSTSVSGSASGELVVPVSTEAAVFDQASA